MRRRFLIAASLVLVAASSVAPTRAMATGEVSPSNWTNRLVVTYATSALGALPAGVRTVRKWGTRIIVDLGRRALRSDITRFTDSAIIAVEPDIRVQKATVPTDPDYSQQWDLSDSTRPGGDYSVHAPEAWSVTTGSPSLVVAVLDTGITSHPEFIGRTVPGYDMISDVLVANDGNGRDGDPSDPGDWITDAENASGNFSGCGADSSSWHGTHVAGTIGAAANNGEGMSGINWQSKIQAVRVLGKCGGDLSDIADGITWASGGAVAGVPANANPARIINLSLGGGSPYCPTFLQSAIDGARSRGSIVVVAAGNSNASASGFTPANCNGVVVVAATARDGKRAYYSNFGSRVTIAAPGGDYYKDSKIYSTLNSGVTTPSSPTYGAYQGTSMATPHVAGVLSLLLSNDPSLTESEALSLMRSTATAFPADLGSNACSTTGNCGAGIINAGALLGNLDLRAAPTIESDPSLPSSPMVNREFTADVGSWNGFPLPTLSYQWLKCSKPGTAVSGSKLPSGCIAIPSARSASYTPVAGDSGKRLRIGVTASNLDGSATRYSATSLPVGAPPSFTRFPSISGSIRVGNTLRASSGTVSGTKPIGYVYQWYSCDGRTSASTSQPIGCSAIDGATSARFTITSSQRNAYLVVRVTATNAYDQAIAFSASTAAAQ